MLEAAFEAASSGMAVLDLEGNLQQVNQALCDLLGRSREELLGTAWSAHLHPDDAGQHARGGRAPGGRGSLEHPAGDPPAAEGPAGGVGPGRDVTGARRRRAAPLPLPARHQSDRSSAGRGPSSPERGAFPQPLRDVADPPLGGGPLGRGGALRALARRRRHRPGGLPPRSARTGPPGGVGGGRAAGQRGRPGLVLLGRRGELRRGGGRRGAGARATTRRCWPRSMPSGAARPATRSGWTSTTPGRPAHRHPARGDPDGGGAPRRDVGGGLLHRSHRASPGARPVAPGGGPVAHRDGRRSHRGVRRRRARGLHLLRGPGPGGPGPDAGRGGGALHLRDVPGLARGWSRPCGGPWRARCSAAPWPSGNWSSTPTSRPCGRTAGWWGSSACPTT